MTSTSSAHALESFGVGLLPGNPQKDNPRTSSIFVHQLRPGQKVKDSVKVVNTTNTTKTVSFYPVDSVGSSDGAFACAQKVDERKDVGAWIKLPVEQVTLASNTNKVVPFTITVPETADVGEHNGCIAAQDISPDAQKGEQSGIVLSFRSALRVAITVPGDLHADLQFTEVRSKELADKVQISPLVKNDGNVSVDVDFTVSLVDVFGATQASDGGQFPVLTHNVSQFNFELTKPFWGGWYKRVVGADYKPLPQSGEPVGTTKHASAPDEWVFVAPHPTAVIIGAALVAILLGIIGFALWRRYQKKLAFVPTTEYTVRAGQDIQQIAIAHGTTWQKLARLNDLKPPYKLSPGQTLRVPQVKQKNPKV